MNKYLTSADKLPAGDSDENRRIEQTLCISASVFVRLCSGNISSCSFV